ncbi:MAG: wax ester/triacylglycerol synthase domain-containing protein, partial [Actinomycetota bacterium]
LRRTIRWPATSLARPCWVDDPDFDVADHVDAVDLAGGDLDALRRHAESLFAEVLPPDRPLWHLRFVTGLTGDRVGLIERVHHALVDGVSGVDVATVLLDLAPEPSELAPTRWEPEAVPDVAATGWEGTVEQATAPLRALAAGIATLARDPARILRGATDVAQGLSTLLADGPTAPRSPLNRPVGPRRSLSWISTPLPEVKAAGRAVGGKANDVVLAAFAEGLRALELERGESVAGDGVLKVLVPVSLRDLDQRGTLGNRVGALILRLPIGIADPAERLRAIASATARLNARRGATAAQLLLAAADLVPGSLVGPIAHLTDRQRMVNVIATNVPGPDAPLWCRGARMLEAFPFVPLGGNLGCSVAILSYDGALTLGVTTDPDLVPDVGVLDRGIVAGFEALGVDARIVSLDDGGLSHPVPRPARAIVKTADRAPTRRSAAAAAAKKRASTRATVKKATSRPTSTRKAAAKAATAKRAPGKKAGAKPAPVKKPTAKNAPTKKAPPRRTASKPVAAKRAPARKGGARG